MNPDPRNVLISDVGGRCLLTFRTVIQLLSWLVWWPLSGITQLDCRYCKHTQQRWADTREEWPLTESRRCLKWSCVESEAFFTRGSLRKNIPTHILPLAQVNNVFFKKFAFQRIIIKMQCWKKSARVILEREVAIQSQQSKIIPGEFFKFMLNNDLWLMTYIVQAKKKTRTEISQGYD